jgi:ribose transport system substrate-binding protein
MPRPRAPEGQRRAVHELYLVKSLVHGSEVLWAFRQPGETLRLRDVMDRTGFAKGMCFRLLYTLRHCGFIEKVEGNRYRLTTEIRRRKKYRIGYAGQGQDSSFADEVRNSLARAAERAQVELVVVDNRYQPRIAIKNAQLLIREGVDLAVEFQTDESVAPAIASAYHQARIPIIAIDIPHPGATYFGANNYEAGLIGGRHLGRWAKQAWHGDVEEIVMIALERAGSLPKMRLTGMLVGMKEVCPQLEHCRVTYVDGDGKLGESFEAIRKHLRVTRAKRILVGAINDPSALGALRAFQEAGRSDSCAMMGQNAAPEGRAELRQPGTRLTGSVAYFPEKYGAEILSLALDILHRRPVPPAIFVKHQLVTPENVDHIYPNDRLMQMSGGI